MLRVCPTEGEQWCLPSSSISANAIQDVSLTQQISMSGVCVCVCVTGLDDLVTIAKCVGGQGLAAVCRLLAEDFSGWAGVFYHFWPYG